MRHFSTMNVVSSILLYLHFTMPLSASHSSTVNVMEPSEHKMVLPGAKSTASFG